MRAALALAATLLLATPGAMRAQARPDGAGAADSLPSVTLPPELDRVLRDYERGWRARDASALARLFAADGFVLRPGHPPVRGRAAIARAYAGAGGALHLRALAFATADTTGWIVGAYGAEPGARDAGKFVLALRRRPGGAWEIAADMDNGNGRRP